MRCVPSLKFDGGVGGHVPRPGERGRSPRQFIGLWGGLSLNEKKVLSTQDLVLCALFSALIAVGAFIRIPLPLLPVPLTLQFFFSNLASLVLGRPH